MNTQIVAVFCLCDDMLKRLHHYEDPQCQMSDSEVMSTAIAAAQNFRKNNKLINFFALFHLLGESRKDLNHSIYVICIIMLQYHAL
jgi:hypothetical protein